MSRTNRQPDQWPTVDMERQLRTLDYETQARGRRAPRGLDKALVVQTQLWGAVTWTFRREHGQSTSAEPSGLRITPPANAGSAADRRARRAAVADARGEFRDQLDGGMLAFLIAASSAALLSYLAGSLVPVYTGIALVFALAVGWYGALLLFAWIYPKYRSRQGLAADRTGVRRLSLPKAEQRAVVAQLLELDRDARWDGANLTQTLHKLLWATTEDETLRAHHLKPALDELRRELTQANAARRRTQAASTGTHQAEVHAQDGAAREAGVEAKSAAEVRRVLDGPTTPAQRHGDGGFGSSRPRRTESA